MLRYILKRILLMIPVLLGIVVIVITLMYVGCLLYTPGFIQRRNFICGRSTTARS